MDEEWPQENKSVYNGIGPAFASGDNHTVQHDLGVEMDGFLGSATNLGNTAYDNAGIVYQGNSDGQTHSDQTMRTVHVRRRHSKEQIEELEAEFWQCPNPDEKLRLDLSRRTGLSVQQVQIWFQNRRNSEKDWWSHTFSGIVASATTSKIITPSASQHGLVQLMNADLRVLSPRVPVRKINFIRQCQRLEPNIWVVVDVSTDGILGQDGDLAAGLSERNGTTTSTYTACRLLPSGCHIQELNNGYCKVTWIVNMVHDGATVPPLYHPLFRSGKALGACRWLASLQRRCEYLSFLHSNPIPTVNNIVAITPERKKSILELAQRMTVSFYEAMCGPGAQPWRSVDEWRGSCGIGGERFEVAMRVVTFSVAGGANVLRATMTVWLPGIPAQHVFDYLCDGDRRNEWDIFANGATILQEAYFATGQLHGNAISLMRTIDSTGTNNKLILQESSIDTSCMVLAYATTDEQSMQDVMDGGGNTSFALLPSGLVVLPDGHIEPGVPPISAMCSSSSTTSHKSNAGSLVSTMYQTLLSDQPPENLSKAVVENVANLLCHAIKKIKSAVHANVVLAA